MRPFLIQEIFVSLPLDLHRTIDFSADFEYKASLNCARVPLGTMVTKLICLNLFD